jgi:hypothetical protein
MSARVRGEGRPTNQPWDQYAPSAFGTTKQAREIQYDVLRRTGYDHERASEVANVASERFGRMVDPAHGAKPTEIVRAGDRAKFRVRFPWEPEDAGITL